LLSSSPRRHLTTLFSMVEGDEDVLKEELGENNWKNRTENIS
jgi:hypothetical protein